MDALERLQDLLRGSAKPATDYRQRLGGSSSALATAVTRLEKRFQESDRCLASEDQIRRSLQAFVELERLDSIRDAQRVCFGLGSRISKERLCLFEDGRLFPKVLDRETGVDQWLGNPRAFRRCFRGLTASYFSFDGGGPGASSVARHNWIALRDYLHERIQRVRTSSRDPDWVDVLDHRPYVFSGSPFGDLPRHALAGDNALLQTVFEGLLIDGNSWFRRELLLAQVRHAVSLSDAEFVGMLERLVRLIQGNSLIRDEALAMMLERYMECRDPVEIKVLRDPAVEWWGNPWLPSNELHWGRVKHATRDTVARWLHKEFIEAFFSKLATDSEGDRRRARFWLRYLGSFTDMKFGLCRRTLYSQDPDFKMLVKKMQGLYGPIDSSAAGGDAFIMTLGTLVVVEFGGYSNAMYAYDAKRKLPFVVDANKWLLTAVDAPNSLKNSSPRSALRLLHQDNVLGYDDWEDRFANELKQQFDIVPPDGGRLPPRAPSRGGASRASVRGTPPLPEAFYTFAKANKLSIEDLRARGGNLWVRAENSSRAVNSTLQSMGFSYKPGKGWWKGR